MNRPGCSTSKCSRPRASHHAPGVSGAANIRRPCWVDRIRATPQACAEVKTPIPLTATAGSVAFMLDLIGLLFLLALLALAWCAGSVSGSQLAW